MPLAADKKRIARPLSAKCKRRLSHLADYLDTVVSKLPRWRFNMTYIVAFLRPYMGEECGTACCALGWAPMVPALKKAGLTLKVHGSKYYRQFTVTYRRAVEFDACREFFDIKNDERTIDWIFTPSAYVKYHRGGDSITPKFVAKRIRNLVAAGGLTNAQRDLIVKYRTT